MQNMEMSSMLIQDAYYHHQLAVNVFNIHNMGNGIAKFYVYHQGLSKKGLEEITTFLLDYINTEIPEEVDELHLFWDGCLRQNKNNNIIQFL